MIALDVAVSGLVLTNLAWPAVLIRVLSARQAAPEAVPDLQAEPRWVVPAAALSGPQDAPPASAADQPGALRVFRPDARPPVKDQYGRFASAGQPGGGSTS